MVTLPNFISGIVKKPRQRVIDEQTKASEAWRRICLRPIDVSFVTAAGTKLPTQTVRLESDNRSMVVVGPSGTAPIRQLIIYGIINHASLPNTIMKEGYTFKYNKDTYVCKDVVETQGEIQGVWESTG